MYLLYCFCNASLTQRALVCLSKRLRWVDDCVTVVFLNDYWLVRVGIGSDIEKETLQNTQAFLSENGLPHTPCSYIQQMFDECISGTSLLDVMNRYHVAVISHGKPQFEEIRHFQETFVKGLGYCPPSLV